MSLASSKTLDNLKAAFAGESQANRRYLYFAQKADVEGYNDVAGSTSMKSRCPWAWPVSPSAVERNTTATSL